MNEIKWIGRISITSDDNIPRCMFKSGLIGSSISLSFLKDYLCPFFWCDFPGFIFGITIDDDELKIPFFVVKIISIDRIDSFSYTSFFIKRGDNDINLQNYSLQGDV